MNFKELQTKLREVEEFSRAKGVLLEAAERRLVKQEAKIARLRETLELIRDDPLRPYLAVERAENALTKETT